MLDCRLTGNEERKSGLGQDRNFGWVRTWGAAVLRPYMNVLKARALFIAESLDGI